MFELSEFHFPGVVAPLSPPCSHKEQANLADSEHDGEERVEPSVSHVEDCGLTDLRSCSCYLKMQSQPGSSKHPCLARAHTGSGTTEKRVCCDGTGGPPRIRVQR